ncbi:MAG TPA: efflux RND transporter periplasmic adaptor subunit [Steroidobacteraceae bacterium]|nr:efflux RND transporter periplasmic adaptor subunit [Steroidobacteraceae bacterium]
MQTNATPFNVTQFNEMSSDEFESNQLFSEHTFLDQPLPERKAGFSERVTVATASVAFTVMPIAALLLLAGCSSQATPAAAAAQGPSVSVAAAVEQSVSDWDEFTGRIEAVNTVEVRPRVTGYLDSVNFKEGSIVKKGDLLFVIDARPYRTELDKGEAALARAKSRAEMTANDVARAEKLLGGHALSREEYERRVNEGRGAAAEVRAAQAQVEAAKLNVEFTRVTAPIAGRVSKAEVTAGNLVSGGSGAATLLTTVVSIDPIYVSFEGDEQAYLRYSERARRGDAESSRDARKAVKMGLANEDDYPHDGYVTFVDNQVNPRTGTIRGRAVFDNKDGYLTPGLFARIRLLGAKERTVVLVDDRAIGTDQSQKFVYVIDAANTISYRAVKPGRLVKELRVIDSGLAAGELVVVNGLQRVRPGVVVNAERVAMGDRDPGGARLAQR